MASVKNDLGREVEKWAWLGPSFAVGLYVGRVFSEWLRSGLIGAIIITTFALVLSILLTRRTSLQMSWPAMLLLLYVFYPDPNPRAAVTVAMLSGLTFLLTLQPKRIIKLPPNSTLQLFTVVLLAASFLLLYITTLATDVLPADNGEFQLVAAKLGIAHPPGFPLYTMLAHLMTRLPINATAAYKVNLLSAFFSTITLVLAYLIIRHITGSRVAGIAATLVLGTSTTFWVQATTANIRSLTTLFTTLSLFALLKVTSRSEETSRSAQNNDRYTPFYLFLFFMALSLGITHHTSMFIIAIIFITYLLLTGPTIIKSYWWIAIIAGLVGLIPLAYLPIRAAGGAFGTPSDLTTLSGFLNHILALGFRGDIFYFEDVATLWRRLMVLVNVFTFQFPTLLIFMMVAGLAIMFWRNRSLALLLSGSIIFLTLIAASYRAPQTVEYLLPAYALMSICLGFFLGFVRNEQFPTNSLPDKGNIWQIVAPILIALAITTSVFWAIERFPNYAILHDDTTARNYASQLLTEAPEGAVILADWHWVTPLWYLQQVEGLRSDVDTKFVFPTNEEYAETWARRINEEFDAGRPVIATHFDESAYAGLPPAEPIGEAFLFRHEPRFELPADFTARSLELTNSVQVIGYKLNSNSVEPGEETVITLAWQPTATFEPPVSMFVHMIGSDGNLFGQQDLSLIPQSEGISLTQFRLTPRLQAPTGEAQLMTGIYNPNESISDSTIVKYKLTKISIQQASRPTWTANPTYRPVAEGDPNTHLIGYDWDNTLPVHTRLYLHWQNDTGYMTEVQDLTDLPPELPPWYGPWGIIQQNPSITIDNPAYYIPFSQGIIWRGQPLDITQEFVSGQIIELDQYFTASLPVLRDLIVSIRLVGFEEDGFHWDWWDLEDGVPAMGAIPTLKWMRGTMVRDPHWPLVDHAAKPKQLIEPLLRLYDAFTGRPLPILDERITNQAPWVPLGKVTVSE